jgi:hypothetical protein
VIAAGQGATWALTSLPSGKLYWRVLGVDVFGTDGPLQQ